MDKQQNSKPKSNSNLLKMLPKAMSFGQRMPPFSPGRDLHHHQTTATAAANRAFMSGPIIRLVPVEARVRRTKNDGVLDEPTSPKVSCIGQIVKTKCSEKKKNRASPASSGKSKTTTSQSKEEDKGRRVSVIKRMFSSAGAKPPKNSHPSTDAAATATATIAAADHPSLGKMKKFASSREALADFDWTVEMNREESPAGRRRDYYSDDETRVVAHSAPLSLTETEGLKPKKEVNLWKRRTMNPPRPLQIRES